jgi:glycosyltransferase involved in cell wall biosynthesis
MSTSSDSASGGDSPLVSVIIPTYGRNEQLPEAVESVLEQSYDNVELLIVDDGSPTPVSETLTGLSFEQTTQTTFLRHEDNRGANAARNSGIRAASGQYVAFLDDDDLWGTEKLNRQVEAFESGGPEVGVVYTGKRTDGPRGTNIKMPAATGDVLTDLLTGEEFGQFSSIMVRSDVIDDAGLPDERFPSWQDREWLFRLAQHCHFESVDEVLTYRRVGGDDRITKDFEQKRDVAYPLFVEKHYPLAREHGLYYARSFLASLRMDLAWSAVQSDQYDQARKYFWLAFFANPFHRSSYPHLIASIGGEKTYESAAKLRRKLRSA